MAGGGLIQLVSIGAQDVYLVGNPQITFFKVTYQRHTNFARECIKQDQTSSPGWGKTATFTLSRSGDLIGPMHVEITLPSLSASVAAPANPTAPNARLLASKPGLATPCPSTNRNAGVVDALSRPTSTRLNNNFPA